MHIAEQRLAVQQLVILPAPADLPHVAPPRHWVGRIVCISTQVAEVTCSRGGGSELTLARSLQFHLDLFRRSTIVKTEKIQSFTDSGEEKGDGLVRQWA